ncbi:MAG: iron-containing alcohol dehydrogenase [Elusimicrobiota bacterium]|jgi:alcohol dehydrogenase class IV|nr:iron-containing alcohol dehydrogenase [Elusimicrobiota bacterium]
MARFTLPRDLYYGRGTLAELKNIKGKRAIVVIGGSSMKKTGFVDKVTAYLKEAGLEVRLFEGVEPDPSTTTVEKGAAFMREYQPDWIVSIGGGSPIDAAKAMWIFYEYPDAKWSEIEKPFNIPTLRNKARFIAIPSTSGTATEVTAFSVITDYTANPPIKYPLADFNITPDIGILDPDLVDSMPQDLTAFTGMDALTHATEAYVSTANSPFTDPLAIKAIQMIFEFLIPSYESACKKSREAVHYAQCLAGQAFSNALLGITHSMAHKTGAVYDIPHGCANAVYLPYVIAYNAKDATAQKRYADIARALNLKGSTDDELVKAYIAAIKDLNKKFQIPLTLKDYNYKGHSVKEADFLKNNALLSERAVGDACTGSNPRAITPKEMEKLFDAIYFGKEVNF